MNQVQIEVRITTFRRPEFLMRALKCLQSQTHANWRAVVYDDSAAAEGQLMVHKLADPRIVYCQNPSNLGMVRNTSQAFAAGAYFAGSRFACVLEDDNLYHPELLRANAKALTANRVTLLARNYQVNDVFEDGSIAQTDRQPMRVLWGDAARKISYLERVREAFFSFTLGNLGYFWDLTTGMDISVSQEKHHGPVSEVSRAISYVGDCWYEPEPLATFSRFVCKSQTPRADSPASKQARRLAKVSEIQFTRRLISIWTGKLGRSLGEILDLTKQRKEGMDALQRLAEAGSLSALIRLKSVRNWIKTAKSIAVGKLYQQRWHAHRSLP